MLDQPLKTATRKLLNIYFKINGNPAGDVMSDGQLEIFASIAYKLHPRISCLSPTGYGKSEAVGMGVIIRTAIMHESFIIGSVKYGTSEIIMNKIIEHIFDNDELVSQLEIDNTQKLSQLKRERNKSHVNFRRGGSFKIVSLHGAEMDVSKAIGEHGENVVLDESPLLSPGQYLQLLKVLEGTGDYNKTFLFELGNAINRNHFMFNVKSNSRYYKIDISLDQAIAEGRLDPISIEEKRGLPFFEQFYLCQFPDEDEIDEKGYRQLVSSILIDSKQTDDIKITEEPMRMGVDVGAGGDYNVYVIRQGNQAWIEAFNRSNDTMTNVNEIVRIIDKYTYTDEDGRQIRLLKPHDVFIDDIGIGRGVTDRLQEMFAEINDKKAYYNVNGVSVGAKAQDPSKFYNQKAENFWLSREWLLRDDTKLMRDNRWHQFTWIKYKISTDKVLQIESKDDLKKREGKSPDFCEAAMLTFSVGEPEPNFQWL
jgi:hypothetical protein